MSQGSVIVSPAVVSESRSVSSRPILTSRGLCEYDKRRFIKLLAARAQVGLDMVPVVHGSDGPEIW